MVSIYTKAGKKESIRFEEKIVNMHSKNEQLVVYVKHDESENSREIVKLYPKDVHYIKGLELNHKPLVDMSSIAGHIADNLNLLYAIGKLDETRYERTMGAYALFIDKWLRFERVQEFITVKEREDDWV